MFEISSTNEIFFCILSTMSRRTSKSSKRRGSKAMYELTDDAREYLSSKQSCKDHQRLLRAISANEDEYTQALLNRYGTMRNVFNMLCHLETYSPHRLPELDYTLESPSPPEIYVSFSIYHPINNNNCQSGGTYTPGPSDAYTNIDEARIQPWLTDVATWNKFQKDIKHK